MSTVAQLHKVIPISCEIIRKHEKGCFEWRVFGYFCNDANVYGQYGYLREKGDRSHQVFHNDVLSIIMKYIVQV